MKKMKKMLAVIITSVLTIGGIGGAFVAQTAVRAETVQLQTEVNFETEYEVGASVALPTTQIVYGGKALETLKKVTCPDGSIVTGEERLEIVHQGEYSVEYVATAENGEKLSKTYTFKGYYPL